MLLLYAVHQTLLSIRVITCGNDSLSSAPTFFRLDLLIQQSWSLVYSPHPAGFRDSGSICSPQYTETMGFIGAVRGSFLRIHSYISGQQHPLRSVRRNPKGEMPLPCKSSASFWICNCRMFNTVQVLYNQCDSRNRGPCLWLSSSL